MMRGKTIILIVLLSIVFLSSFVAANTINKTCVQAKGAGLLKGHIDGNVGIITSKADTGNSYLVGLAVYKKFGDSLSKQRLFDYETFIISPNQTRMLIVDLPDCKYQIDLFCGDVIMLFNNTEYGDGLFDYGSGEDKICKTACANNTSCGVNGFINNAFCQENDVFQNFRTFTCNNPNTADSFCSNLTQAKLVNSCSFACLNGACIRCDGDSDCNDGNVRTEDKCINPGTVNASCQHNPVACLNDNECGINGFIGNNFCSGNSILRNFLTFTCNNPGTLSSFCSNSTSPILNKTCQFACLNGNCIACNENSDCNDNNQGTEDICLNPGQANASCQHNTIKCSINSDCGINGFVGSQFCVGNNISKKFVTFSCNNAGTSTSFCSNSTEDKEIEYCQYGCLNGICKNATIVCFNNNDCNDNNTHTEDKCINPGTVNASCQHIPIACLNDNECGINGFIGNNFCINNGVFKSFLTFTCNNPGTSTSFCSNSTEARLNQTCEDMCFNGACIERVCTNNEQCGNRSLINNFCSGNNVFSNYSVPECLNDECTSKNEQVLNKTCEFGCNNGECLPQPQQCTTNNQCGNASSVLICDGDDLKNKTTTPICIQGSCQQNISFKLVEECENGCSNGECKEKQEQETGHFTTVREFCGDLMCGIGENEITCPEDCQILPASKLITPINFNQANYTLSTSTQKQKFSILIPVILLLLILLVLILVLAARRR